MPKEPSSNSNIHATIQEMMTDLSGSVYNALDNAVAGIIKPPPEPYTASQKEKIFEAIDAIYWAAPHPLRDTVYNDIHRCACDFLFMRIVEDDLQPLNKLKKCIRDLTGRVEEFKHDLLALGEATDSAVFEGRTALSRYSARDVACELQKLESPYKIPLALGVIRQRLTELTPLLALVAEHKNKKTAIKKIAQNEFISRLIFIVEDKLCFVVKAGDNLKENYDENPFYMLVDAAFRPLDTKTATTTHSLVRSALTKHKSKQKHHQK